jgi:hypothetical protein
MTDIFGDLSRAEMQREIDALKAELAALKAHDPLTEMWAALESYQPQADADGHGDSWRTMCRERTEGASWAAADAAAAAAPLRVSPRRAAAAATEAVRDSLDAARAAVRYAEAMHEAARCIAAIKRAKVVKP